MAHFKAFSVFQTLVLHLSQRLRNVFNLRIKLNWYVQIKNYVRTFSSINVSCSN